MSRRVLLIALIVSLAVNLFVLGGLAGAAMMGWRPPGAPPPPGGPQRLFALGSTLSPAQRAGWEAAVRQTAEGSAPKIHEARALRREAWRILAADPVDPQAALAALDQSRTLELQARAEMDRAVVAYAATLPPDQRRKLGEALSRPHPHPPGAGPERVLGGGPAAGGGEPRLPDR
jgi:uncharacterized membrane protein